MSELSFLLLAGGMFGILALGRVLRSVVVRRLAVALALVCVTALVRWGVKLTDGTAAWEEWTNVALLLALGYLTARSAMLLLFDWLLDRRMGVKVPRLARDVVGFVAYLLMTAAVLRAMLGLEVTALLATSAVITVVIGLALQETLGTLLAGLSLSSEHRLASGWWVDVDGLVGEVEELGWRSLVLRTTLGERVLVPNSQATRARMRVLGKGEEPVAVPVELGVAYDAEPARVKGVLEAVANDLPLVAGTPHCKAFVRSFGDSSIHYQVRLWTHQPWREADLRDDFLSRAYAALGREGMEIPFPQRVLHVRPRTSAAAPVDRVTGALGACPLFAGLPEDGLHALAEGSRWLTFEPGEAVVREGEASRALYVIAEGAAACSRATGSWHGWGPARCSGRWRCSPESPARRRCARSGCCRWWRSTAAPCTPCWSVTRSWPRSWRRAWRRASRSWTPTVSRPTAPSAARASRASCASASSASSAADPRHPPWPQVPTVRGLRPQRAHPPSGSWYLRSEAQA